MNKDIDYERAKKDLFYFATVILGIDDIPAKRIEQFIKSGGMNKNEILYNYYTFHSRCKRAFYQKIGL